jgi:signal transduction histidine kinase
LFSAFSFYVFFFFFLNAAPPKPDVALINDAAAEALRSGDRGAALDILSARLSRETERVYAGKQIRDNRLRIFAGVYLVTVAAAGLLLYMYCERGILGPFRKMRRFAENIAAGNLDIPLTMDRQGNFGAFTESFDLMREELNRAKENERNADQSKKGLVASLSHDIKTPVASIKAVTEYMLLISENDEDRRQLETINAKAEQINSLITNMFHATLEELHALSVTVAEVQSTEIRDIIKNADHEGRIQPFMIPDCIISADMLRLQQVFDNIIGNSYKYAGTDIEINSYFGERYLIVEITDFGKGVPEDELPLLTNKFYRGKNTGDKSGYGLGLYISKYLMEQMPGSLKCENRAGGFTVRLALPLAG